MSHAQPSCGLWWMHRNVDQCRQETAPLEIAQATKRSGWTNVFSSTGWDIYIHQPVLGAAVSLALLYLTVLSLGLLMTAYLNWKGMSEAELSLYRGLGALAGVSATFAFPTLQAKVGRRLPSDKCHFSLECAIFLLLMLHCT